MLLQSLGVNQLETKLKSARPGTQVRVTTLLTEGALFSHLGPLYGTVLALGHKGCTVSIQGHTLQAIHMYCQEISQEIQSHDSILRYLQYMAL